MNAGWELWLMAASAACAGAAGLAATHLGPLWDGLAGKQVADLTPRIRAIGLDDARLPVWMRWWGLSMAAVVGVVGVALRTPILVPPLAYLIYVAPRTILEIWIARRKRLLRDQMAVASVALANTARAGLSLAQGLESLGEETPEPLASEIRRIVNEFHRGRPLAEAIQDAKQRLDLDSFTTFAAAVLACLDRGGRITEALEGISRSLQEAQRLERKLDAETASGRQIVIILGAFPLVFLAGFGAVDPVGTGLVFTTLIGQLVLVAIFALIYMSVKVSQKILNLDI